MIAIGIPDEKYRGCRRVQQGLWLSRGCRKVFPEWALKNECELQGERSGQKEHCRSKSVARQSADQIAGLQGQVG